MELQENVHVDYLTTSSLFKTGYHLSFLSGKFDDIFAIEPVRVAEDTSNDYQNRTKHDSCYKSGERDSLTHCTLALKRLHQIRRRSVTLSFGLGCRGWDGCIRNHSG